ncbi:MAG: metal ABC transporter ATP-binding protein [Cyanobacteriota bacterium]|nr:metal ABC transporter ATP-binding protein [Cyanobacteriota bacterium]
MVEMILEVNHLTVCRRGVPVVEDVSFSLPPRTDTALVGPNGAGKSTLVMALLGVLPRSAGEVRVLGHRLGPRGHLPAAIRQQIAYLPQSLHLQEAMPLSVGEFVALGWEAPGPRLPWRGAGARREAVARALVKTGAEGLGGQLLTELSGGQLRRVLLAFCVVRPRRLLVLDEAQTGLDAPASEAFVRLIDQLRRSEGWTILQVSHDLDMVRRTCDRVLCLNRQLRCCGTPDHALSPSQLALVYGPGYVPYHHHHQPSGV